MADVAYPERLSGTSSTLRTGRHQQGLLRIRGEPRGEGERYLVAMLGEGARWVANVRAPVVGRCCGTAGVNPFSWGKSGPGERAPILRRYVGNNR